MKLTHRYLEHLSDTFGGSIQIQKRLPKKAKSIETGSPLDASRPNTSQTTLKHVSRQKTADTKMVTY